MDNRFLVAAAAGAAILLASAADAADGRIIFASGGANIQRAGTAMPIEPGTVIRSGDTVQTGQGRVQWRMQDDAVFALKSNTTFRLDDYSYTRGSSGHDGKSVFSLLRGGFRTITGLLGKVARDSYQARTPVATMGIRGTSYTAIFCQADCVGLQRYPDGLWSRIEDGVVTTCSRAGCVDAHAGQFVYTANIDTIPVVLNDAPAIFLDVNLMAEFEFVSNALHLFPDPDRNEPPAETPASPS